MKAELVDEYSELLVWILLEERQLKLKMPGVELLLVWSAFVLLLLCDLLDYESPMLLLLHVQVSLVVNPVLYVFIKFLVLELPLKPLIELVVSVVILELISDDLGFRLELFEELLRLRLFLVRIGKCSVTHHQARKGGFRSMWTESSLIGVETISSCPQGLDLTLYLRLIWSEKLIVRGEKVVDQILMLLLLHLWVIEVVGTEVFELFHGLALCRKIPDVGISGSKIASPILFLVRKCPLII